MSALVVSFNNADDIGASLDALLAQDVPGGLEVIVVDNASTDGTAEVLRGYADRVRLVLRNSNSGYAAANNEALGLSRGLLVALVNPDCVVDPGCLEKLAAHLTDNPGVGLAAANLRDPDGTPQLFARRDVNLALAFWSFTELGSRVDRRFRSSRHALHRRYAPHWPPTAPMPVDCPAAACVVLWRSLAKPTLFDEALPLLFNDAELYRRLRARSYRLEVVPSATAVHGYGTSLRKVVQGRMRAERVVALRRYVSSEWGLLRCALLWLLVVLDAAFLLGAALAGRKRGRDRVLLRGTLGALGLPGGVPPWLSVVPGPTARLRAVARKVRRRPRALLIQAERRRRRRTFLRQLRRTARRHRVVLAADVDRDANIEQVVIELRPRSTVALRIDRDAHLREGTVLRLGGELVVGSGVDIRWGVVLNVKGRLVLEPRVTLGRGTSVHCDGEQVWGFGAVAGEFTTVLDTDHGFDGTPVAMFDQPVTVRALSIGAGAFLGSKATVLPGATVGCGARVGAGAVLTKPLAEHRVALGQPATIREADIVETLPPMKAPARKRTRT